MADVSIDGQMTLKLPAGFSVMSTEEVQRAFSFGYNEVWGARNERRNMMLACIWKDAPALLGKIVSTKALVDRAEKTLRKVHAKNGYRYGDTLQLQIAGEEAQGFSYDYTVENVGQHGEVIILRHGKRTYTFYYFTRPERVKENWAIHDALLESMTF